ncbi:synaptonemal complex protein 1-like [Ammospiza maritima maritima]
MMTLSCHSMCRAMAKSLIQNPETMNELFSKLYKEAEKIKQWKLTVESELNQKERKLQENRKIIEAQNKAIQELQFENEKLHLKLEDEMCENKDLLKEAAASRHLCNLLKETCTRFAEKTRKYSRMTVAFEELHVQAEDDRLEMSFKLKEEAEKADKFEKECKLEVAQKNLETEFQTTVKTLIQVTGEKLQLEMENMNKQHKEEVDIYKKDIETRKVNENKLCEEVEKMRLLCDETAMIERETDARCQHKITEMGALMEKHKNEYDKMVEEKENELSCLKKELSSLKEQLKAEMEENLVKEHSGTMIAESEKKHKVIKTPPMDKMQSGRSTNLPAEQSSRKKQKVLVQLDTESDSSEHTDLLSIVSEEEMFKNLYKDYPQASQLHSTAPKKSPAPCSVKSPGSALKLKTMRRMRQAGWTALSKMNRKRKIKDTVKLFA